MKIIRDENDKDIILEVVFAENEDPVKCLEVFREIEKNRLDIDKVRIEADKAKCEMSHETNRHNMTKNTEIAAMQADVFNRQMAMTALMPILDANMKAVNPAELANKIVDNEFKDIELTATDENDITDNRKLQ